MKGIPFPEQDVVLGAPVDWDEEKNGPCDGLPVQRVLTEGLPAMRSVWAFTPEERAAIARGANIELGVIGTVHPPVWLAVLEQTDATHQDAQS